MDKEEATRICGQCHKEVAEANFALHETHCSRFLCVCPDCDETVPREQLTQHKADQHAVVRCSKCNKKMERRFLLDHESDECMERLQSCPFCDLELPWKDLQQHRVACGSRTELCRDCGRYVKLSDQAQHSWTCSGADGDSSPDQTARASQSKRNLTVSCSSCMASFPEDEIDKHKLGCHAASMQDYEEAQADEDEADNALFGQATSSQLRNTFKATSLLNGPHSPWGNGPDPNQISTCPHCHLALPIITLRWHQVKCQRYILLK
ncbi:XIAP-associated factor 1 [Betta splendens]|uniref:XIAP-associated factor 1 n=1 Tax=Betta splendens TaxID=158456 RepID=A0A6P7P7K3_BETSP|nr:XIAP-associated factor 1 [Betta splendens]XP_029026052.1 XIAP-associated factor 1 [Betta splendens]